MAGEARAHKAWRDREHGWYVVNSLTDIAVARCCTQPEANAELRRRDGHLNLILRVVGVGLADAPATEGADE